MIRSNEQCKGIDLVYHTGKEANVYNIGGRRRVYQHGNHQKYQKVLKQVGIIYPRFPDLQKNKNHVGK